jgi:hypothetical protein
MFKNYFENSENIRGGQVSSIVSDDLFGGAFFN